MLRLILSPEQFAAALLCGSNLPIDHSLRNITRNNLIPRKIVPAEKNPEIDSELAFVPKETANK